MKFCIQVSNPRLIKKSDIELETSLEDAIEGIYPLFSEMAILIWNGLYIPLSYKYDISLMIKDILELLELLINEEAGDYYVWWPSNTFFSEWKLSWVGKELKISTRWESVTGDIEDKLNSVGELEIDKNEFLREWKKLLLVILEDLKSLGYSSSNLLELSKLEFVEQKIVGFGKLYS